MSTTAGETSTSSTTTTTERHFIVVAIDFGTTYSGYAFSWNLGLNEHLKNL